MIEQMAKAVALLKRLISMQLYHYFEFLYSLSDATHHYHYQ